MVSVSMGMAQLRYLHWIRVLPDLHSLGNLSGSLVFSTYEGLLGALMHAHVCIMDIYYRTVVRKECVCYRYM